MNTFPKLLLRNAKDTRDAPSIRVKRLGIWQQQSWKDVLDEVENAFYAFDMIGIKKDSKVAIVSPNNPEMITAITALHAAGAVAVMIHPNVTGKTLVSMLRSADVEYAFVSDQQQVDSLLEVADQHPIKKIIYISPRGLATYDKQAIVSFDEIKKTANEKHRAYDPELFTKRIDEAEGFDPAFIFFSSGTGTAQVKPVVLSFDNLMFAGYGIAETLRLRPRDDMLVATSLAIVPSMLLGYVLSYQVGFCLNCPESSTTVLEDMREIGPSLLFAPPNVYKYIGALVYNRIGFSKGLGRQLYRRYIEDFTGKRKSWLGEVLVYSPIKDLYGLGRLRYAISSGSALSSNVYTFFEKIGVPINQMYGAVETAGCITLQNPGQESGEHVGHAAKCCEVKVNEDGEILCRGTNVFHGYYNDSESTDAALKDSWFHVGDYGHFNDQNQLIVTERLDTLGRLADGKRYSPSAIVNDLKSFVFIQDAIVIGDGKEFLSALLVLSEEVTANWADHNGVRYAGYEDLISKPEVASLIADYIGSPAMRSTKSEDGTPLAVSKFVLIPRQFTLEEQEITYTNKICPLSVMKHFDEVIDAVYQEKDSITYFDSVLGSQQQLAIHSI